MQDIEEGNLSSITYPDGSIVSYIYDAAGRLAEVTDMGGTVTSYHTDVTKKNGFGGE